MNRPQINNMTTDGITETLTNVILDSLEKATQPPKKK